MEEAARAFWEDQDSRFREEQEQEWWELDAKFRLARADVERIAKKCRHNAKKR